MRQQQQQLIEEREQERKRAEAVRRQERHAKWLQEGKSVQDIVNLEKQLEEIVKALNGNNSS